VVCCYDTSPKTFDFWRGLRLAAARREASALGVHSHTAYVRTFASREVFFRPHMSVEKTNLILFRLTAKFCETVLGFQSGGTLCLISK
jgi:hypothetical protein